jgi:hypothetical protein
MRKYEGFMVKHALMALTALCVGTAGIGFESIKSAEAVTFTYDFTVDVTSGTSVGKYKGNFSFDPAKPFLPCDTAQPFYCANPVDHDLKVQFNFLGKTYTEKDDIGYNFFPNVVFNSPIFNTQSSQSAVLSFLVDPAASTNGFFIFGNIFRVGSGTNLFTAATNVGTVSYALRPPDTKPGPLPCENGSCTAVPEPSEIAGSGVALGLLGLVWSARRKRNTVKLK